MLFRHQASQLPMYQRANVSSVPHRQSKYMPVVEEILSCPSNYLPDEEWEIDILHSFSELRLVCLRVYRLLSFNIFVVESASIESNGCFQGKKGNSSSDEG